MDEIDIVFWDNSRGYHALVISAKTGKKSEKMLKIIFLNFNVDLFHVSLAVPGKRKHSHTSHTSGFYSSCEPLTNN